MHEPRGHTSMYGAALIPQTELTLSGEADMGVLFLHHAGWSTMCGHATLALGRFLVDTHDPAVFPLRHQLLARDRVDAGARTVELRLHAPCGVVRVTVPTNEDASKADPSREISFLSVPCWAAAIDLRIMVPEEQRWPHLVAAGREAVVLDVAYGGAFYAIVSAADLGWVDGLRGADMGALDAATKVLKDLVVAAHPGANISVPGAPELDFLYSVLVVDTALPGREGEETGLCFFGGQQVDRSPTGSAVGARVALAVKKGERKMGQPWTYHSVVSLMADGGEGAFVGVPVEKVSVEGVGDAVVVKTSGRAWYCGASTFMAEEEDIIGKNGFELTLPPPAA